MRGFTFIFIVLATGAALTALALAISMSGAFAGGRIKSYQNAAETRVLLTQCAETLLLQVRNTTTLTGSGTLTVGPGSCAYTITGSTVPKTITITATKYNLNRRVTITISALTPILATTWVEGQ